mmetsp:Transcript_91489/g.158600  ORF Transcript_91489/g.158600 Transcript_91489/m.158600 type:complete len:327 (-) Transcript_91489:153-1133(-)
MANLNHMRREPWRNMPPIAIHVQRCRGVRGLYCKSLVCGDAFARVTDSGVAGVHRESSILGRSQYILSYTHGIGLGAIPRMHVRIAFARASHCCGDTGSTVVANFILRPHHPLQLINLVVVHQQRFRAFAVITHTHAVHVGEKKFARTSPRDGPTLFVTALWSLKLQAARQVVPLVVDDERFTATSVQQGPPTVLLRREGSICLQEQTTATDDAEASVEAQGRVGEALAASIILPRLLAAAQVAALAIVIVSARQLLSNVMPAYRGIAFCASRTRPNELACSVRPLTGTPVDTRVLGYGGVTRCVGLRAASIRSQSPAGVLCKSLC